MNKKLLLIIILLLIALGSFFIWQRSAQERNEEIKFNQNSMKIFSPSFQNNGLIPKKYTCDGENVSPPLQIAGVPEATKSLVLIVDDPDAPSGDWVHWLVWNVSPETAEIAENSIPENATEGLNDFGQNNWGGPCPPSGTHHYQFKLYALDTELNLESSITKKALEKAMKSHILGQAILVSLYQR